MRTHCLSFTKNLDPCKGLEHSFKENLELQSCNKTIRKGDTPQADVSPLNINGSKLYLDSSTTTRER